LKICKYLYEMETGKFGSVRVRNLSIGAITEIAKRLPNYKERPGRDITVASASVLCVGDEDKSIDGAQFTDAELAEFAEKFLEARPRLTINDGESIAILPRNEGESSIDYFGRVITADMSSFHNRMLDVVEKSGVISAFKELNKLSDMVKQSSSLSAFAGLKSATDSIRSALQDVERFSFLNSPAMKAAIEIEKQNKLMRQSLEERTAVLGQVEPIFERMEIPTLPPNPIYKTNKKLEDLTEHVGAFTGALMEHLTASAVALKDVAEQIEKGSKSTTKQNNIIIGLAVVSLIVAILAARMGYLGYSMGKSASEKNTVLPAVVAPVKVKPQLAPTAKAVPAVKPQQPDPNKKHRKVPAQ